VERSAPRDRQSGFALLFVFVLILVLVVSGLLIAGTTRTDTQVVNTIRNERIAFYAAEAGIAEAFQRLGLASGATSSPSGVGTFDPTFKGAFAPDSANVNWQAQIAFASAGTYPSLYDANTVVTPSIQPTSAQLPYSTATVPSTDNLRLQWSVCTAVDAARGCEAVNTIRKIDGKNVLQIVSTGRSGPARRQLTMDLFLGDATSAVVLRSDICPGVNAQGSGTIEFPGGVTVNSDCDTAMRTKGASAITAAGPIQVQGGGYTGDRRWMIP
jgi:Tfp pilus assembly protein PilX